MNLKGFDDMPEGLRRGLIVGVSFLFFAGLLYFLYLPKIREVKKITTRIGLVEKEIEKAKEIERNIKTPSREEEKKWKEVESRLYSLIPPEEDIHDLIYKLADLAKKCNILDIAFKSEKEMETKVLEGKKAVSPVIPTQIAGIFAGDAHYFFVRLYFHSDFKDLARFLEEIQGIDRLMKIESLVIKRSFPRISVEMVVMAYYSRKSEVGGRKSEVGYGNKANKVCERP